ncbi:MAG: 3'-5' exonuclease [Bacteroides sp.]|nr:3'-5' exonuclease [Bacteroides sp.]
MEIICLDAEFTENEELLELSVFDLSGKEIYHRYYKPENISTWRTDIHHITPEMVANELPFSKRREEVQRLLDSSFALTGFAVGNDLRVLSRSGITGMETKRVIDVKDMYWYLRGLKEEMSPFSIPSLLVCANTLGLEFSEEDAHSASADTEATLRCFTLLFEEFRAAEGEGMTDEDIVDMFTVKIDRARARFVEESARGFVKIYKQGDTYKIKYSHVRDAETKSAIAEIEVADRYKAEYEIKKLLKKKELPDKWGIYKLTPKLLEEVKRYRNTYDAEESAWCKKVVRNLSRLTL